MNHYQKAIKTGKKELDEYITDEWGNDSVFYTHRKFIKSFLDSYAQDIRLAVIEDVRERALIKVRKTDFGNENSEDIKHNEIIMDFLAKLPSER